MAIALILFLLVVGRAALLFGADSRVDDVGRRRRMTRWNRKPLSWRRAVVARGSIVIRRPEAGDDAALVVLAQLADRPSPPDPLLLAESDGKLVAAVSTATGESVSDPFVPTADVIELLRLRASQLDSAA